MNECELRRVLIEGGRDVVGWLAQQPTVTLADLSRAAREAEQLAPLCDAADVQTQLALSRFRMAVVARLVELATSAESGAETARRACVELLRLDLRPSAGRGEAAEAEGDLTEQIRAARAALYDADDLP